MATYATVADAVADWKLKTPFPVKICPNGQCRNATQAEYDAMAQDRGQMLFDAAALADADAQVDQQAQQMIAFLANLDAGTAQEANVQKAVAWLLRHHPRVQKLLP